MARYDDVLAIGSRGLSDEKGIDVSNNVIYSHYPLHNHEFFELGYVMNGSGTTTINGKRFEFSNRSLFLCTNTDFHDISPKGECSILDIHIRVDLIEPELLNNIIDAVIIPKYDPGLIERLDYEYRMQSNKSKMYLMHLITSIIIDCIHAANGRSQDEIFTKFSEPVGKAIKLIHNRFSENITLLDLSEAAELSPNYLSSKFHKEVGVPIQSYLINKRLEAARKYLLATQCSVTDLCFFSGFNNYVNFSKAFKKKYGVTPTQYRLDNQNTRPASLPAMYL